MSGDSPCPAPYAVRGPTRSLDLRGNMMIFDRIYGDFKITDPLALELIKCPSFERLKNISQVGIPSKYYNIKGCCSRFDHSVGVYIFLNRLGANQSEQIAGLLHDVSHLAFSHLADWVLGDQTKEDAQDKRHQTFIEKSEIAGVLGRAGLTVDEICDYHRYALLEKEIPDICADRIDYALREAGPAIINATLPYMAAAPDGVVFSDITAAKIFANHFLERQESHWGGYEAVTRYAIMSELLKLAIANGDLAKTDFDATDEAVLNKITSTGRNEYLGVLDILSENDLGHLSKSKMAIVKKFRYVDPTILVRDKQTRLSDIDADFKAHLETAREKNRQGVFPGKLSKQY
jgi:uncharacterized protein